MLANAGVAYAEIDKLRTDTTNVAALATGALLADNFGASAKQERRTGFVCYGGGWTALVAGLVVYLNVFGGLSLEKLSWEAITLKFGFSAAIVGGAAIAFKLGSRSFKLSSTYKRTELELRAIGPFLADVAESDQTKKDFIERSFGQNGSDEVPSQSIEHLEISVLEKVVPRLLTMLGISNK